MLNFVISFVILALSAGAQETAKPADTAAKPEAAKCPMHAKAEAGADKTEGAKACCAKHSAEAKDAKAAHGACNHGEAKAAEAKADGAACCAKHAKSADAKAAHGEHATASCNHDAKPAVAAADAKTTAKAAYACPMHSDVTSDKPGDCSKCGMKLEKKG